MALNLLKRPAVERDIEECFVYIAENDLDVGIAFMVALQDSLDQLSEFPLLGQVLPSSVTPNQTIRVWRVKGYEKYLIFYCLEDENVDIVRVLHSSRNITELFEQ